MILIILPFPLLSPLKIGAFTFGTERLDGLVEWTFSLFDTDESGAISVAEFIKMAELMGLSARKTEKLQPFLDRDRSGKITMSEFRKAEDAAAELFSPLMEMQSLLRDRILGEAWWNKATVVREHKFSFSEKDPFEVYEEGGAYRRSLSGDALLAIQKQKEQQATQRENRRKNRKKSGGLHALDGEFDAVSKRIGGGGGGGSAGGEEQEEAAPYYYEPHENQ